MIDKEVRVTKKKEKINDILCEEISNSPDSFFTSIYVDNVLEDYEKDVLYMICKKLRINGKIRISGTDILVMCRDIIYKGYPHSNKYLSNSKSFYTILELKDFFEKNEWKIIFMGLKDSTFNIEAIRTK